MGMWTRSRGASLGHASAGVFRRDQGRHTLDPARALGVLEPYAPLDTIVFSRREPAVQRGSLRITAEDPVRVARDLKARPGRDLWLCGGAQLAGALLAEIDEIVLKVNPVLAGAGIPLFHSGFSPRRLELRARRPFASGVTWLTFGVGAAQ